MVPKLSELMDGSLRLANNDVEEGDSMGWIMLHFLRNWLPRLWNLSRKSLRWPRCVRWGNLSKKSIGSTLAGSMHGASKLLTESSGTVVALLKRIGWRPQVRLRELWKRSRKSLVDRLRDLPVDTFSIRKSLRSGPSLAQPWLVSCVSRLLAEIVNIDGIALWEWCSYKGNGFVVVVDTLLLAHRWWFPLSLV